MMQLSDNERTQSKKPKASFKSSRMLSDVLYTDHSDLIVFIIILSKVAIRGNGHSC